MTHLPPQDQIETIREYQRTGSREARDRVLLSNLRLVIWIARRYSSRGITQSDLIHEGFTGMLRALEKFDPDRGLRFSTYATHWIRQKIRFAVDNKTRVVRVPDYVHSLKGKKAVEALQRREVALSCILVGDADFDVEDKRVPDRTAELDIGTINDLLDSLGERAKKIILARFGFYCQTEFTLGEVAKVMGISRERVRQIEKRSLRKIRKTALRMFGEEAS